MSIMRFIEGIPERLIPSLKQGNRLLYVVWRECCHMVGSIVLIVISQIISSGTTIAVFILLIAWMTYQEFYLHPKKYHQLLWKGIIDWISWILPFVIYFLLT